MKRTVFSLATLCGLLLTSVVARAQSSQLAGESFSWSAEFVALDEAGRTITVEAPAWGEYPPADFGMFKTGERLLLRWSGYDKYADAISRGSRPAEMKASGDRFTFPADFVSYDRARKYVTFKVQIPENSIANLKSLKPGEWVTATSPHGPLSKTTPVTTIRPYILAASAAGSN